MPKPTNKKRPFIDKKNAVSFQLIHRSQQDPLAADEEAPQMILQRINKDKVKEEERQFGVFFEDDYNYLQHLKDRTKVEHDWEVADRFILERGEKKSDSNQDHIPQVEAKTRVGETISLPRVVFPSNREEEVGLLNKAAHRGLDLSLDPDIVAAMDDDFDYQDPDNELDDDFIMKAMGEGEVGDDEQDDEDRGGSEEDWETDSDRMGGRSDEEDYDEVPDLIPFDEEETKTRFTNYSMSSSIIRRNKELSLLDDKFERFMDQYGELDEGALDGEDIEGAADGEGERMEQLINETEKKKRDEKQNIIREREAVHRLIALQEEAEEKEDLIPVQLDGVDPRERWDCESILSTYSNIYNHPKLISERRNPIQLSSKTGIPKDTLGRGLTAAALRQLDHEASNEVEDDLRSVASRVSMLSVRNKHETVEEKRFRKTALKEFRRERRVERKVNAAAFKMEKLRQEKILINNQRNVQGNKIL